MNNKVRKLSQKCKWCGAPRNELCRTADLGILMVNGYRPFFHIQVKNSKEVEKVE